MWHCKILAYNIILFGEGEPNIGNAVGMNLAKFFPAPIELMAAEFMCRFRQIRPKPDLTSGLVDCPVNGRCRQQSEKRPVQRRTLASEAVHLSGVRTAE